MLTILSNLKTEGFISELNYQFAKMIDTKQKQYNYSIQQQDLAIFLSALVSFNVMQGHSCIDLSSSLTSNPFELLFNANGRKYYEEILQKIELISPLEWQVLLKDHIAFSHTPSHIAPLIFQNNKLYFYRYWQAEYRIANYLKQKISFITHSHDTELDKQILSTLFDDNEKTKWQKIAVATALNQTFSLISGGPGTGKTRTVASLLAALQIKQLKQNLPLLKIALVAPTGKAAARLKESITANLSEISIPESIKSAVPIQASTIHRLIGINPNSDKPFHNEENPLHIDLIVIDEASMIDLFIMEKLLYSLKSSTRIVMLGDKDQLASVEVGNIMGELGQFIDWGYSQTHCNYLEKTTGYRIKQQRENVLPICDSLCHLKYSFRFSDSSGIGQLAAQINAQQAVSSWQIIANKTYSDLNLVNYPESDTTQDKIDWISKSINLVVSSAISHYKTYLSLVTKRENKPTTVSVESIFTAFQAVRFLSALRISELGSEKLNQSIANGLLHAKLVDFRNHNAHYTGKPILITQNSPQQHLYSGDIGIILPNENGELRVYFETKINEEYLNISPSRLPSHEPAYVMTVHKSQGSEFKHTFLIMPLSYSPVISKELLYTAVTRAKENFTLFSHQKTWEQGVKTKTQHQSGLMEQLLQLYQYF
ncbi:exodeoxyribonuclease V subunit alpha [Otariodibacter oris]|uniref:RecBCD enzyme subunit RecD n=1 Tax=Otariodibacter oris TaxID=1032623 RepID=A0A420XIC9_9PAST|nr:exodeoxyribonuclease V subunit alpha [Otariodibacter oris]QGM80753.1 exodeoxyribonuclease V subunit alpha [Otariodibacter oris]RKR77082.1 DNA helicase/exodeoxyribonuclease V alpha subunit [Otariodibacter oris]